MPKLYGDIIKGKEFMSFEFTDNEFSKNFGKEDDFKKVIVQKLKPFDPKADIKPTKANQNILVLSEKNAIVTVITKQMVLILKDINQEMIILIGLNQIWVLKILMMLRNY